MSEPAAVDSDAGDDDEAWLGRLRDALGPPLDDAGPRRRPARRAEVDVHAAPGREAATRAGAVQQAGSVRLSGTGLTELDALREVLRAVEHRLAAVEEVTDELARAVRRATVGPELLDLEKLVTRILRTELPGILLDHAVREPADDDRAPGAGSPGE